MNQIQIPSRNVNCGVKFGRFWTFDWRPPSWILRKIKFFCRVKDHVHGIFFPNKMNRIRVIPKTFILCSSSPSSSSSCDKAVNRALRWELKIGEPPGGTFGGGDKGMNFRREKRPPSGKYWVFSKYQIVIQWFVQYFSDVDPYRSCLHFRTNLIWHNNVSTRAPSEMFYYLLGRSYFRNDLGGWLNFLWVKFRGG